MDLNMPVMDGFDATLEIIRLYNDWKDSNKALAMLHPLHVVAVTAFTNEESVEACYKVGMTEVLHKPVNAQQLMSIVDEYHSGTSKQETSITSGFKPMA